MGCWPTGGPASRRRRHLRDPDRAFGSAPCRGEREHRRHGRLIARLELAPAVQDDRSAHPGGVGSSVGVTFFIGGRGEPPRPGRPPGSRRTSARILSGAATNGARYATIRIGTRKRAAIGRTTRKKARAQTHTAYRAIHWVDVPPSWSLRAGRSTSNPITSPRARRPGGGSTR